MKSMARYGGKQGDRRQIHSRRNFRIEPLYFALAEGEVIHEFAHHQPVMIRDAAAQSQSQFRPSCRGVCLWHDRPASQDVPGHG